MTIVGVLFKNQTIGNSLAFIFKNRCEQNEQKKVMD